MVRDNTKILVTGQYWHSDFSGLISSNSSVTVTLYPAEKIYALDGSVNYDLIVVAQARRNVLGQEEIDHLQAVYPNTPTVALLGSWCEGEVRSGEPWAGIPRVYWNQWKGEFESFVNAVEQNKLHQWQLPKTATVADRIQVAKPNFGDDQFDGIIGVSAWTNTQYSMVADALSAFGAQTCWIERTTWDGQAKSLINAIVLDDESMTSNLENRIRWLFSTLGQLPLVLSLSFPRKDEIALLKEMGVGSVVSKPFKLAELKNAILEATGQSKVSTSAGP